MNQFAASLALGKLRSENRQLLRRRPPELGFHRQRPAEGRRFAGGVDQAPQDRGGQQQTERKQKRGPIALSQECFIHDAGHQPCFGNKQRAACHAERERRPELPFAARKPVQRAPAFLSNHAHQPRSFFLANGQYSR